jgi:hypothetical protein
MTETRERKHAGRSWSGSRRDLAGTTDIRPECHGNLRRALTAAGLPELAGED